MGWGAEPWEDLGRGSQLSSSEGWAPATLLDEAKPLKHQLHMKSSLIDTDALADSRAITSLSWGVPPKYFLKDS